MKRALLLIVIAVAAFLIVMIVKNPDFLSGVWLWIIGLIGPIIGFAREGLKSVSSLFSSGRPEQDAKESREQSQAAVIDDKVSELEKKLAKYESADAQSAGAFSGTTLTALRYLDDGETTLGLLFIDNQFFCYTLEDTHRDVKIPAQTRIPAGAYSLDFNVAETPLTLKYRQTRPWFDYHLEIKNVPDYSGVYIHSGGTHEHTAGCLLVSNGILSTDSQKILNNSRSTFENLYKMISKKLKQNQKVRIRILDEDWFEKYNSRVS